MNKLLSLLFILLLPVYVWGQSKRSNQYYEQGTELYNAQKYEEAIWYFQKSDELDKKQLSPTSENYYRAEIAIASCLNNLACTKSDQGNYQEAIRLGTEAMKIYKKVLGEEHPDYATSLGNLAGYYSHLGNYQEAIRLGSEFMEIYKKYYYYGEGDPDYATSLYNLANFYEHLGNYQEAIRLETEVMEIRKKVLGEEHPDYATSLGNLAIFYEHLGNYQEAIRLGTEVMEIYKKALGEEHPDYATSLSYLATYYSHLSNYQEAIRLGTEAMQIDKKVLGVEHPDYATSLCNLAGYYSHLSNYQEAIRLGTEAMEIFKKVLGEENPDYAASLGNLASYYSHLGNYQGAIRLGSEAMEIRKKVLGEEHPGYAASLGNLAGYYDDIGNYQEAIRLETEAMQIKKVLGEEHPDYATSLCNLATFYSHLGNYQEAIRLGTEAMQIDKKVLGEEHPGYATSLGNLAGYYDDIGNYQEAIRLGTEVMEIYKKALGEEHPDYATSLCNLAGYYSHLGNYQDAIRLGTEAMEIFKKVLGEENPDYATSLGNLASYYSLLGNYQGAIRLGSEVMEIHKKVLGVEHPDYATSLGNLATYYDDIGNYQEAIRLGTEAMEIFKKVLGEEHPDYATSLCNLAYNYFEDGKYDEATALFEQSYKLSETLILKTFAYLTNKERSDFWNKYSVFFNKNMPTLANEQPNSTLKSLAFNGQLLSKGLLLNAELEIQNLIEKQGNEELKEKYNKLRQDRKKLDELYLLAPAKRTMNTDSLSKVVVNEERSLVESSKEIGDYTKNLSIKWTDIQKKLKNNDVAIEFANFIDSSKKEIYIALILKKGMTSPELVKLFETNEFNIIKSDYYTTSDLYNIIWKPLDNYLQGVDNVYFSPTGKFHTIGIEYLPDENGEIFAKKYNAYRLSSTRELALTRETNPNKKASVYGGIVYNFDESDWQNVSDDAERGGQSLNFLKAAKKESEEITNILTEGSFNVVYGTDKAATEGSFKKLSGSGIKILHIATHGFYEPENKENYSANMLNIGDRPSQEDLSLNRSGLYFAGANTALDPEQRKYIPDGVDDGILTAKEISRLDFKGLDLVALSACETGLGEVTGEGVFGLQRGFKKAGAQTIVMSLWKVNDKPTKELMTEFYRNLMAGKSKRDAFVSAQDKIRQKYIDPRMWAGFIMVDGTE